MLHLIKYSTGYSILFSLLLNHLALFHAGECARNDEEAGEEYPGRQ